MNWYWYLLFNSDEFMATELCSRTLSFVLEGIGTVTVLVSRGNMLSITYDNVYMPVNLLGINPYQESGYASFIDSSNNVWLGIEGA